VREETGLDVAPLRLVGTYQRSGFRAHEAVVFECQAVGGALATSRETPCVAWFDLAALPDTIFPWIVRREHQGVAAIAAGARIDLAMRWRGES
jgi:ADP-ribose pyrophosphatase YjhB (NUDIX family)